MECRCGQCMGTAVPPWEDMEEEEEEVVSIHDRLGEVADTLEKVAKKHPDLKLMDLVNELNDLCDEVDSVDTDVINAQKKAKKLLAGSLSLDLGEISKRLL
ncbi:hypothetical protein BpsS36_00046 [Bacillus phage vB_BpsS-36]|uniref:Uncharacterized protein n=1 Tax=Bacillus phage vB_BpsS-36 TaxID=2419622 RepID=A0A3G3BWS6_9CAUD|nr:hypothetical protein BpsS36_00046 [Bacillus phage vB_BpsS-36]